MTTVYALFVFAFAEDQDGYNYYPKNTLMEITSSKQRAEEWAKQEDMIDVEDNGIWYTVPDPDQMDSRYHYEEFHLT